MMTVPPSIDSARFLEEHLAQASPDLLRHVPYQRHQRDRHRQKQHVVGV